MDLGCVGVHDVFMQNYPYFGIESHVFIILLIEPFFSIICYHSYYARCYGDLVYNYYSN